MLQSFILFSVACVFTSSPMCSIYRISCVLAACEVNPSSKQRFRPLSNVWFFTNCWVCATYVITFLFAWHWATGGIIQNLGSADIWGQTNKFYYCIKKYIVRNSPNVTSHTMSKLTTATCTADAYARLYTEHTQMPSFRLKKQDPNVLKSLKKLLSPVVTSTFS